MNNLSIFLFFLVGLFIKRSKGQDFFRQDHYVKENGDIIPIFTVFHKIGVCNSKPTLSNMKGISTGNSYSTIFTIDGGDMLITEYSDEECQEVLSSSFKKELDTERSGSEFLDTILASQEKSYATFESISIVDESSIPEYANLDERVVSIQYGFSENDTVTQQVWIKPRVCATNYLAFGEIEDTIWADCDENSISYSYSNYANCSDIVHIFNINTTSIERFKTISGFTDFEFLTSLPKFEPETFSKCLINGIPEEGKEFVSDSNYLSMEFYYNEKEQKECLGTSTLKITSKLDTCSAHQIINSNSNHLLMRIYGSTDLNCQNEPVAIHYYRLDQLAANEEDKSCLDLWMLNHNYYMKPVFFEDYQLSDFSNYIAMINHVDCDNINKEYIVNYKYNLDTFHFYYAHDDFCIDDNIASAFVKDEAYKGYCKNGEMFVKKYTQNSCKEIFFPLEENYFCIESIYYTCLYYICYGKELDDPEVCQGHGECVDWDTCKCNVGWEGVNCSIAIQNSNLWFIPLAGGLGGGLIVVAVISSIIIGIVWCHFGKQQKELKDFKDIEDIDILLQESKMKKQELEETGQEKIKLSNKSFEIDPQSIELKDELGSGGSGSVVYLGIWSGKEVAYKIFKNQIFTDQRGSEEFEKELEFAISLRHPNVLQFFGCTISNRIGIVMEYCSHGSLQRYVNMLKLSKGKTMLIREKLRILSEIASAMQYLKNKGVIHRDLKSENVLLNDAISAKVMDFGLSKKVSGESNEMTRRVGTSFYMAPEVNFSTNYTYKVDIFSYAVVMWELFYENFNPYGEQSKSGIEIKVAKDTSFRPKIAKEDEEKYPEFFKIMRKSWDNEPDERPEWKEILTMLNGKLDKMQAPALPKDRKKKKFSSVSKQKDDEIAELERKIKQKVADINKLSKEKQAEIEKLKEVLKGKDKEMKI